MALTDKLTAIADATRAKTGTTNQMTLDEIATAINGISSGKEIVYKKYTMPTGAHASYVIDYTKLFPYVDMNFPFYLVFGVYINNFDGTFNKIVKVDTKNLTIKEIYEFGGRGALNYSINDTNLSIYVDPTDRMKFSQTTTPGYVYILGISK